MATQEVRQRNVDDRATKTTDDNIPRRPKKRAAMAKRGLRSLAIAVAIPFSLTLADVVLFGHRSPGKLRWVSSLWALHSFCLISSVLMGLSAWLVWADGGFHRGAAALALYATQLGLSLAWDPVVFRMGDNRVGLALCVGMFGAIIGCGRVVRSVNPIAGDLLKPCLAWVVCLAAVNITLLYL